MTRHRVRQPRPATGPRRRRDGRARGPDRAGPREDGAPRDAVRRGEPVADARCGRAPSTGWRCSTSSACGRSASRSTASRTRRRSGDDDAPAARLHRQRPVAIDRRRAAPHAARGPARRPRADRHEGVLPGRGVRRVHRPGRRPERGFVPDARGRGGRHDGDHGRGAGGRRPAPPAPAGVPRHRRRPVRVLHPGPAGLGAGAARAHPAPDPRRGRGRPRRQPLPLRRLRADHRGRAGRRGRRGPRDDGRGAASRASGRPSRTRTWRRSERRGAGSPGRRPCPRHRGAAVRRRPAPRRRPPRQARRARCGARADRPDRRDARRSRSRAFAS